MDTSDHGLSHLFKGTEAVANGLTGIKNALSVSSFSTELEYTTVFKCPHR